MRKSYPFKPERNHSFPRSIGQNDSNTNGEGKARLNDRLDGSGAELQGAVE